MPPPQHPNALIAELYSGKAWDHLSAPDEEYLKVAVTHLLPEYYSMGKATSETGTVLNRMAIEFVTRHGDTWLRDALQTSQSRLAADAFAALQRAVEAEVRDWEGSSTEAAVAEQLFRAAGSDAGALRARFERVQALQVTNSYEPCTRAGEGMRLALDQRSYSWLRTQTLLALVNCGRPKLDFEASWLKQRAAIQVATQSHYSVLRLRALSLNASWQTDVGNKAAAWREYIQSLQRYWTAAYPPLRAQWLYSQLSLLAPQGERAQRTRH